MIDFEQEYENPKFKFSDLYSYLFSVEGRREGPSKLKKIEIPSIFYYDNDNEIYNMRPLFNQFIERFKNAHNLSVYHNEAQNRFLQFKNKKGNERTAEYIKLYVSFDVNNFYMYLQIL